MARDETPRFASAELEVLWKRALDDWDDDAAHGAFLEHCQVTDQLLEAAVRYRGMSADRERGPSARKRLSRVALLAMASLESQRTTPRAASRHAGRILLSIVFLAAAIALLFAALI